MDRGNFWPAMLLLCGGVICCVSPAAGVLFGRHINSRLEAKISDQGCSYPHKELFFEQQVDHFSFHNSDTFQMRYLISDKFWKPGQGPIFFYTGNEGDITWFCDNTGFVWDTAPDFQALVVFAEHRYYGKSLPYGNDSYKDLAHLAFLTAEQALADYAVFVTNLKAMTAGAENVPVVAFGGSYGGMLAAWMRIKYPSIISGSLAASAPVWQFTGLTPCYTQFRVISEDFLNASQVCHDTIHQSWGTITRIGQTASGRATLTQSLQLCDSLKTEADVNGLIAWLADTLFNLAMVDYPYPASFLEPLPAFPIKVVCSHFTIPSPSDAQLLEELHQGLNVYYNYTGNTPCLNLSQDATGSLEDLGWGFQSCTEMVMPSCADGKNDMFYDMPWDYDAFVRGCQETWGVTPRPNWMKTQFGGKNITASSNIYFSNGLLDPWHGGGVLTDLSDTLVAGIIPDGAHHLDLRGANKADPPTVLKIRQEERDNISRWIAEWWKGH
ncbi:lysosomal Pro-X carboxypeptidase-like [Diadema setosum]|uniref:lysosomal Pro-X carboxypeptidase-like n=1 Tax=Diadema setosum TaxID=31175 RepID=UPI003B3BA0F4